MAANDAPRGAPQSAAYTLFSILQPSNHCHIHNSYTSDSEVYYNPSLTLRVWLYLQLYKNRRMGCLSVPSTYRLSRTLVLHSLSDCLCPAILRQRHALCMSFLHHWSILCMSHQYVPMLCRYAENTYFYFAWLCYAIPNLTIRGWGHTKVLVLSPMPSHYERAMNVNEEGVMGFGAVWT